MADSGRWNPAAGDPSFDEVNRADRFLDALAEGQPVHTSDTGDAELAELLAGWRDEVRTPPMPTGDVASDPKVVPMRRGGAPRGRRRTSMAVFGSVAAAALFVGGFGAVVSGAGPGDALYGLRTMLFGEDQATRDDEVVLAAQTELAQAQLLIDQGDWQGAQEKLQAVTTTVATVADDERKQDLVNQWRELAVKVESRDVNATVPPDAPPATLPEVPLTQDPALTVLPEPTGVTEVPAPPATPEQTTSPDSPETTPPGSDPTSEPTTSAGAPAPATGGAEEPGLAEEGLVEEGVESDGVEPGTGTAEPDADSAVSATPTPSSPAATTTPSAPASSAATTEATTAPTTSAATSAAATSPATSPAESPATSPATTAATAPTTTAPATSAPATSAPTTTAPATTSPRSVPTTTTTGAASAPAGDTDSGQQGQTAAAPTSAAPATEAAPQEQQQAPVVTTTVILPLVPAGEE